MSYASLLLFFSYLTDTHPSHPFPIYILKACIKINFGVVKLLYVPSHIQYLFIYIYIYRYVQKFASIQNSTEVYILKSTMQYINGLPGLSKTKLKEKGGFS